MNRDEIPTEQDWLPITIDAGMDEGYAIRHFLGKSYDEAFEMFQENALNYSEDLMYMTPVPLRFYIIPYSDYLMSKQCKGDNDGASCYISLIKLLVELESDPLRLIWPEISNALESVACNQGYYDADVDIYGSFLEKEAGIMKHVKRRRENG